MKQNIDYFFNKIFLSLKEVFAVLIKIFSFLIKSLVGLFDKPSQFLYIYLSLLYNIVSNTLTFFINGTLFIFITIPWWFFVEILKPNIYFVFNFLAPYLNKYKTSYKLFVAISISMRSYLSFSQTTLYNFYVIFWKKFIDFLFFGIFRKKNFFLKNILRAKNLIFYTFIVLTLLYFNIFVIFFNYIFTNYLDTFFVWDLSTYTGVFWMLLSFFNLDNLFLLIYLVFFKIGLYNFFYSDLQNYIYIVGFNWTTTFSFFKSNNPNFSFFNYFLLEFSSNLIIFDFSKINFFSNLNGTPVFFFFGCLFFFTVTVSWVFFSYLGLYGIYKLNLITLFLFWLSLLFTAKSIFVNQKIFIIKLCSWAFLSLNTRIDYYFLVDTISFSFMLLTTTIAFFVFIYAFSYFRYEPLVDRFLLFILSFVISMIFLVTSGNTIMLFLGWELIGFTSFCLINFWTTKAATLKSAFKAFTFNKVSDFFMFMFLVSSYSIFYTFDILSLNNQAYKYESSVVYLFGTPVSYLEFLSIMIIGAAFIKSAQFGGHAWLPDSMEAPVPASSLIHSATLVSAGVYLILRFNFIFDLTQFSKFIIPVVGSFTAAYGGICAVAQSDIKKTLAYSTISHCGFLMVLCATEMNEFTILYLYVHGFFKAGVFMCVGNVLRITRGYQDTRRMGGLVKYLPFEYFCATVGLLNLAGLPFTFGFFIKHLLLISLDTHIYIYYFVIFHCLVGAFAGLFYSFKIINYTFGDFKKGNKVLYLNLNKLSYNSSIYTNSSLAATLSVFFLFIFSYVITYFLFKYFLYSNYLFSDYMNTTILSNYYSTINSFNGYLLNFSYINTTVIVLFITLYFSKYRGIERYDLIIKRLFSFLIIFLSFFFFLNLI